MNEVPDLFAPKSAEQKQDDFACSTMKIVAKQLGVPGPEIDRTADWYWFNQNYPVPGFWVHSLRVFRFDIADVLFRPTKSTLITAIRDLSMDFPVGYDDYIILFNVYDWGRMFATNHDFKDLTAFRVVIRDEPLWVAPLGDLFTRWKPT